MRVLLDTHAFLWYVLEDRRLSDAARAAIEGEQSSSPASPPLAALLDQAARSPDRQWIRGSSLSNDSSAAAKS